VVLPSALYIFCILYVPQGMLCRINRESLRRLSLIEFTNTTVRQLVCVWQQERETGGESTGEKFHYERQGILEFHNEFKLLYSRHNSVQFYL